MHYRIDSRTHSHPATTTAGDAAMGLWAMAGAWSVDYTTNGWVPATFVVGRRDGTRHAANLVAAGLWAPADRNGQPGWEFVEWAKDQPSVGRAERAREQARERQRRHRANRNVGASVTDASVTRDVTRDVTPGDGVTRRGPKRRTTVDEALGAAFFNRT